MDASSMTPLQQGSCSRATRESCTTQTRTPSPALLPHLTLTTVPGVLITRVWAGGSGPVIIFDFAVFFASASTARLGWTTRCSRAHRRRQPGSSTRSCSQPMRPAGVLHARFDARMLVSGGASTRRRACLSGSGELVRDRICTAC